MPRLRRTACSAHEPRRPPSRADSVIVVDGHFSPFRARLLHGRIRQELKGSAFQPVWDVLVALRAHDDQLAEALDELRRDLGRGRTVGARIPAKVKLDVPETVVGRAFRRAFETRLVEATTLSWSSRTGSLRHPSPSTA